MNINLDEKRIRKIIYTLEDGTVVAYNFKNGDIWCVQEFGKIDKDWKTAPTDQEMIESIRNSKFMDELEDARKRFKISKAIADTFPDKDDDGNIKTPNRKYSDESLSIAKESIKMDKEGKLDEILKRHGTKTIGDIIKRLENPFVDSELSDDSDACQKSMNTIEQKILSRLRMDGDDTTNDDELKELVENYRFYKSKKKEIDDKIWNENTKSNE